MINTGVKRVKHKISKWIYDKKNNGSRVTINPEVSEIRWRCPKTATNLLVVVKENNPELGEEDFNVKLSMNGPIELTKDEWFSFLDSCIDRSITREVNDLKTVDW